MFVRRRDDEDVVDVDRDEVKSSDYFVHEALEGLGGVT